jgi:tRNA threonylcarbamoyladenosine biosynthesis protein TsaB
METSSTRGSVALVEGTSRLDGRVAASRSHDQPNQHAERLLGLVEEALGKCGWDKGELTRIAVGVGPGSFTGVRVGLSIAQGLMLGLGIPGVGVGSLRVIAAGMDDSDERLRVVVRDARREEYFLAAYDSNGREVVAPHAIPQVGAWQAIAERFSDRPFVVVGTRLEGLDCVLTDLTTEPDARPLGRVALDLDPDSHPLLPQYVRGPNVVRPNLPVSPLTKPRIE